MIVKEFIKDDEYCCLKNHTTIINKYSDKEVIAYYDCELGKIFVFKGAKAYFVYVFNKYIYSWRDRLYRKDHQITDMYNILKRSGVIVNKELFDEWEKKLTLEVL